MPCGVTNPKIDAKYKYNWLTCFEPEKHLDFLADQIINKYAINKYSVIFGYSFKDNSLIERIEKISRKNNLNLLTRNSKDLGLPVNGACLYNLIRFTKKSNLESVVKESGKCDVLIIRHVIEHMSNLNEILQAIKILVKEKGKVIFEVPDCQKAFKKNYETTIWEEHFSYFTEETFKSCLNANGYKVNQFWRFDNKLEDSLVISATLISGSSFKIKNVEYLIKKSKHTLKSFFEGISKKKSEIKTFLNNIKNNGNKIFIFGAGHHASTFININNVDSYIDYVLDDNINKQDKFLSGTNIKIIKTERIIREKNPFILLTTNPESDKKIKNYILKLNLNSVIFLKRIRRGLLPQRPKIFK